MTKYLGLVGLFVSAACSGPAAGPDAAIDGRPYDGMNLEWVGHADLDMDSNLSLAIAGNYAYVGYKYNGTIDIVDIADPTAPNRVGGFADGFDATELRAIPDLARLYVLVAPADLVVFDLSNPVGPVQLGSFTMPNMLGHEFFLWRDPASPARVLAVISDVSTNGGFAVLDVSDPSNITLHHRQTFSPLHSAFVSDNGARMYLSFISGDVGIMDSTQVMAAGTTQPATQLGKRRVSDCTAQSATCIAHSTVTVPGRPLAVVTYENTMCPHGWMDIVDVSNESQPTRVGTWRHAMTDYCNSSDTDLGMFGYGPHNPTVTANLALVSWYRAGFLMFDLSDPAAPAEVAHFVPDVPPGSRLAWGRIASVSYPIIKNGLIYVVDGRNGLDILRYVGPHRDEIDGVDFLEGNSNL